MPSDQCELSTLGALLQEAADALPRLDAELLLAHAAGVPRSTLAAYPERRLAAAAARELRALVQRRAGGEPLAYVLGEKEFWSLPLQVSPAVLVPRPETELLVERCLALLAPDTALVADLGTGSGAIAIALAHERPAWRVLATDASAGALALARSNAARLVPGRLELRSGDWYAALGDLRCDALVSNPPYVADDDPALAALAHEPREALVAADEGRAALATLAAGAPAHLHPGGWLLLEHGASQGAWLRARLVARGFARVGSHRDLAGLERVTEGLWMGER